MNFRLATYLALHLVRSRRSSTLSLVTVISIVGMAVGVWALIVVMGVTNGFQQSFQERILGLYPHLVVHKRGTEFKEYPDLIKVLTDTTGVVGASPVTYDDMMIAAGVQRTGAMIKGIDLATVQSVTALDNLLQGDAKIDALSEEPTRFERAGDSVRIEGLIAGTWNTALLVGDQAIHQVEDSSPPKTGYARVSVIDLRRSPGSKRLVLERVAMGGGGKGADKDAEVKLKEERIGKPMKQPLSASLTHFELPMTGPRGSGGGGIELPAGDYDLQPLNERVALDGDTLVTLVLSSGAAPQWLVQKARVPLRERTALLRVVAEGKLPATVSVAGNELTVDADLAAYQPVQARLPGIILGVSLAERLSAKAGDEVSLVTPLRGIDSSMIGPFGMEPSSTRHRVVGTFESGFYDYDVRLALVNIVSAQRFLNRGPDIRWIEVKTEDLIEIEDTKRRVAAALDPYDLDTITDNGLALEGHYQRLVTGDFAGVDLPASDGFLTTIRNASKVLGVLKFQEYDLGYAPRYRLVDWKEMNSNLFGALTLQKVVLALFFSIIIIVGAFVVVGSQMMIIHDKAPDIAILKAMGAPRSLVRLTFTVQGVMVAAIGCAVGIVIGVATCLLIAWFDYELEASIYLIDKLPATVEWGVIALVTVGALITTMVATQYSAGRAATKTPVEGLRAVE